MSLFINLFTWAIVFDISWLIFSNILSMKFLNFMNIFFSIFMILAVIIILINFYYKFCKKNKNPIRDFFSKIIFDFNLGSKCLIVLSAPGLIFMGLDLIYPHGINYYVPCKILFKGSLILLEVGVLFLSFSKDKLKDIIKYGIR